MLRAALACSRFRYAHGSQRAKRRHSIGCLVRQTAASSSHVAVKKSRNAATQTVGDSNWRHDAVREGGPADVSREIQADSQMKRHVAEGQETAPPEEFWQRQVPNCGAPFENFGWADEVDVIATKRTFNVAASTHEASSHFSCLITAIP